MSDWFDIVQTLGIIATLSLTIYTIRRHSIQLRATNALLITQHHRELWSMYLNNEQLKRVLSDEVDLVQAPVTREERLFTNMLFLHIAACVRAVRQDVAIPAEGLVKDIQSIFARPIPHAVWNEVRSFHDTDLRDFVDYCLSSSKPDYDTFWNRRQ